MQKHVGFYCVNVKLLLCQRQQVSFACGIKQVDLICAESEVEVTAVCEAAAVLATRFHRHFSPKLLDKPYVSSYADIRNKKELYP